VVGIEFLFCLAEAAERRPEVLAPVAMRHRKGADGIQRAASSTEPRINGAIVVDQPNDFGSAVRGGYPYQVEGVAQVVRRQAQQWAGDCTPLKSREPYLAERAQVRCLRLASSLATTASTWESPTNMVSHGCGRNHCPFLRNVASRTASLLM
jgi:hypothetical protein